MNFKRTIAATALALAVTATITPWPAYAESVNGTMDQAGASAIQASRESVEAGTEISNNADTFRNIGAKFQESAEKAEAVAKREAAEKKAEEERLAAEQNKVLEYDVQLIEAIGSQDKSGHSICCPSYACAYGDAVLDGTLHDHGYYTCSCCTWNDWGGGASVSRSAASDEALLREAYDEIKAGRPTVIHVGWSGGEHWIALIGYENAADPDHLSLSNFIALDPWDGAQINAGSKYVLYGDGCEHISDRAR